MPELPDVETFRRYLDSTSLHQEISKVAIHSPELLEGVTPAELKAALEGKSFVSTHRHGKYLFAQTSGGKWVVFHFGMTGFLKYFEDMEEEPPHARMTIDFLNGWHLGYDCQRKLGEIGLADDWQKVVEARKMGPDPLDPGFTLDTFGEAMRKTRAVVKSALMNQRLLAGIGNIYSDEILFQAGIQPGIKAKDISKDRIERLFYSVKEVLEETIKCKADPERFPPSYLIPHRHGDGKCPRCGNDLQQKKFSGRTGFFCPSCQA